MASLFSSCCGNDKPSSIAPSATSGRKRSVLLLVFSIAIAFAFQYGVAPYLTSITFPSNYVVDAWTDGCDQYETEELQTRCAGNNGVYRSAASATLFFVLAAIAVICKPSANREAWPAKYVLFCFLVLATCFIPNTPLFSPIYLNLARAGSVIYILIQQIIFIDVAYNWNESWVAKADAAETEEQGTGKKWLGAILFSCAVLFIGSIVGIALLFVYFSGCSTNTAFIAVTLILCLLITGTQLCGEEGSLLASAVMSSYATYLCYTAGTYVQEHDISMGSTTDNIPYFDCLHISPCCRQCLRIQTEHATLSLARTIFLELCSVLDLPRSVWLGPDGLIQLKQKSMVPRKCFRM